MVTVAYEQIITETAGRVGVIRLNRPAKLNAWTAQMGEEITHAITDWNADDGIGAILIAAEGRAFCAGADIGGFAQRAERNSGGRGESLGRNGYAFTRLLQRSKPIVVAIQGYAAGVGLTMALPCDVRIAADDARLSIRFIKMGLIPELGSTRLLAQLVGQGNAMEMCLTGRFVEADEALRMGLVSAVVARDALFETALAKAHEIAENPTAAVMMTKELLTRNPTEPDLNTVMEREQLRDETARRLPDHAEAIAAFREKRQPAFNHRG